MDIVTVFRETRKILDEQGFLDWGIFLEDNPECLGVCRYEQKQITLQNSMISKAKTFFEVLPIVLHEVSHIFCPGDSHGAKFHAKLRELIAYYVFGNS